MASVNVNRSELDAAFRKFSDRKREELQRNLLFRLRELAPKQTGALRDSIRVEATPVSGKLNIKIRVHYAEAVIKGSNPHVIEGAPLVFNWAKKGGMKVFAFHVNHPGTKPNDQWIKDAVEAAIRDTK